VSGLGVAVRYLTIASWPRGGDVIPSADALGRAAGWFPLVGLGLGLLLAPAERAAALLFPPLLAALLTVAAWKLLTGGLHLDGLADCFDGLGGRDPEHRLAIMQDSRIGTFGALGLVLVLLLDVGSLAEIPPAERWRALVVAPVVGRGVLPAVGALFAPARPDGQGARFQRGLRPAAVLLALGVPALVGLVLLGPVGLVALGAAGLVALAFARALARRLSGITGDVLGAAVELSELMVLLTVAAWTARRP
jgi:adenosylcobinamide-GDP ribazoletransferase